MGLIRRLRKPFRVVFIDPEDLRERKSFTLSLGRLYLLFSSLFLLLVLGTATLTLTTPIKYYLPGYGERGIRQELVQIHRQLDSLHQALDHHRQFDARLKRILEGGTVAEKDTLRLPAEVVEKESKKNLLPLPLIREEVIENFQSSLPSPKPPQNE